MLLEQLALASQQLAATAGKKKKVERLAELLLQTSPAEHAIAARYLSGEVGHKTQVGYATAAMQVPPAADATLGLVEVDQRLAALVPLEGPGSMKARQDGYGALLAKATAAEQAFLRVLIIGELRQGALEALVVEAMAKAKGLDPKAVRSAYMLAGEIGMLAGSVLADGAAGLSRFGLTVFRPVLPMLAQTAEDPAEAIASFEGPAALEHKLDGFRVQIHKADGRVRVYSRALNEVTDTLPEIVAAARALPASRLILDGEAIAYGANGRPLPFQDTMKLLGKNRPAGQLSLTAFDVLLVDDQTVMAETARRRFELLDALAPMHRAKRIETNDPAEAIAFYEATVASGHEGVMAKALDAAYEAGSRGAAWLKIKRIHRLDLVVLAVEWGSGRRKGVLSNIHLGARNPSGGFTMVSKTFKGMTDAVLAWQTAELLAREVDREGHIVHVRPELVVEIAFNDVLRSTQYKGGFALRHARLIRYRTDKTAAEADTIDAVRAIAIADGVIPAT